MIRIFPWEIDEQLAEHDDLVAAEAEQARALGAFLAHPEVADDPAHAVIPASMLRRRPTREPADATSDDPSDDQAAPRT